VMLGNGTRNARNYLMSAKLLHLRMGMSLLMLLECN
jgi:hypothetical protein